MSQLLRRLAFPTFILLFVGGAIGAWMAGARVHVVDSHSMSPTLFKGSRIVTMPARELRPQDIVTMRLADGRVVTHTYGGTRFDGTLITKGDNSMSVDNFTPAPRMENVIGVVWRPIHVTAPAFWTTTWSGRLLMVVGVLPLLLLWLIPTKDSALKRRPHSNPA